MLNQAIARVMPAVVEKWEHEIVAGMECVKLHLRHNAEGSSRKLILVISDSTESLSFTSNFDPLTGAVCEVEPG